MGQWEFGLRDRDVEGGTGFKGTLSEVVTYANNLFKKLETSLPDEDWMDKFDSSLIWGEYQLNALEAMIGATVFSDNFDRMPYDSYLEGNSLQYYFKLNGRQFKNYGDIDVTRTIMCLAEELKVSEDEFTNTAGISLAEARRIMEL